MVFRKQPKSPGSPSTRRPSTKYQKQQPTIDDGIARSLLDSFPENTTQHNKPVRSEVASKTIAKLTEQLGAQGHQLTRLVAESITLKKEIHTMKRKTRSDLWALRYARDKVARLQERQELAHSTTTRVWTRIRRSHISGRARNSSCVETAVQRSSRLRSGRRRARNKVASLFRTQFSTKRGGELALEAYLVQKDQRGFVDGLVSLLKLDELAVRSAVEAIEEFWSTEKGLTIKSRCQLSRRQWDLVLKLFSYEYDPVTDEYEIKKFPCGVEFPQLSKNASRQKTEALGETYFKVPTYFMCVYFMYALSANVCLRFTVYICGLYICGLYICGLHMCLQMRFVHMRFTYAVHTRFTVYCLLFTYIIVYCLHMFTVTGVVEAVFCLWWVDVVLGDVAKGK